MMLLLLPHQDDELGAFGIIDFAVGNGIDLLVVYLTDGAANGQSPETRNAESLRVLGKLGVRRDRILFLGWEQRSPDGLLVFNLAKMRAALRQVLPGGIESIYVSAWEGGHQDHDAAAVLAVAVAKELGITDEVFQFPLYNGYSTKLPFAMFNPILEAGPTIRRPIPLSRRLQYAALIRHYPSQWRTFIGLGPLMLAYYLADGMQQYQRLSEGIVSHRPHAGPLLYEKRGRFSYDDFAASRDRWMSAL